MTGIGRTRRQLDRVRQRLAATDDQLRSMSSIIPVAALRARLEQRDFDIEKLREDIAAHPWITASNVAHGYRDNRDSIVNVTWCDGTVWSRS